MEKRLLKESEIDYIVDFIKINTSIPYETALSIMNLNKDKLRRQLVNQKLYVKNIKEDIDELKNQIKKQYFSTLIQTGESVGVITAQCMGEMTTQNTLNTFHSAGKSEKTVITGVPRFEELLNTTHNPKGVSCTVYFKSGTESIESLRNVIGHSIVELNFEKIALSIDVCMNKKEEPWYLPYSILYSNEFRKHKHCISIKLDMSILFEYKLSIKDIADKVQSIYGDLYCVCCSPPSIGQLDIFIDVSNITIDDEKSYLNQDNKDELYLDEVVKPELKKLRLCGIEGIEGICYIKKDEEWIVSTEGSNYLELLALPFIDSSRTISNDIWDMVSVLGIEAAKRCLFEELQSIMGNINKCHIKLLVDKMTYSGSVCSISRYAMKKEDCGPLSKASFEQSLENFLLASAFGEKETTKGVSASIMCGKKARIGTGVCDLRIDIDSL